MNTEAKSRNIARKIWYGVAITLCVLVIILSSAGIVGTWVTGSALSSVTVQVLVVVENTAEGLSALVERIDQGMSGLEEISITIRDATSQIGQNVNDKGLILTLLPEEREQELVAQADELKQTLDSVGQALRSGLELYQSIDNLPFVSLPKPEAETVAKLEQTIADIRTTVDEVVQGIQDFRAGVSEEIGKVTGLVDNIIARLRESRQNLAQLNSTLGALQELAARLQRMVTLIFTLLSVFFTLFFGWIIYGQVELIRLFVRRWKDLREADNSALPVGAQPTANIVADGDTDREITESVSEIKEDDLSNVAEPEVEATQEQDISQPADAENDNSEGTDTPESA